ncbi:MAG: hypothetical protein COB38_08375 [Gammaproteobacteria bacterium]|nr:MAG: hypothetical protein COB38_08375 [Gammaproteobacteria bacterium]
MNDQAQTFVITRPLNQADSIISSLKQHFAPSNSTLVSHLPLIKITSIKPQMPLASSRFSGIIFISPNAVTHTANQLSKSEWKQLITSPLYAIGSRTSEVLKNICSDVLIQTPDIQTPENMNSEGLLALSTLSNVAQQRWLIVKGLGGREKLKDTLIQRGAEVVELCTYQRNIPDTKLSNRIRLALQIKSIWIITSVQAIINLAKIMSQTDQQIITQTASTELKQLEINENCRIIVSSDRIKESAIKLGFNVIAVAKNATDKQLIDCIKELKL